ncbi:hypothetical protein BKA70DRAFT_1234634 [Coprinopsis sp. MPI-PUGE-AT-0042]|nr:hypothetical protein BKA70DRAFT_1234634 [Coprinopsis sp. MPI-PUGE-AT-0042]
MTYGSTLWAMTPHASSQPRCIGSRCIHRSSELMFDAFEERQVIQISGLGPRNQPRNADSLPVFIPGDALVEPAMEDFNPGLVVLGDVVYNHLIVTRPVRSTVLANLSGIFEGAADGGLANLDSSNVSHFPNRLCLCRNDLACPIGTIVELLSKEHPSLTGLGLISSPKGSTLAAGLRDVLDSALDNHKLLRKSMKNKEKECKKMGFNVKRREMREMSCPCEAAEAMIGIAFPPAVQCHNEHKIFTWVEFTAV